MTRSRRRSRSSRGALQRVAKDDSVKSLRRDWTEVGRAVEKVGGGQR
ncbi:hypothetical protein M446_1015 [Methylobacterium sp. 4-46]|nr:hypothetical protein M446_1015 [Methylobacterium sp. 4-46]